MAAIKTLGHRLRCYEETSESWKEPHQEAMRRHDVADALGEDVTYGLYLFERMRAAKPQTFEDSRQLYQWYESWHGQSLDLLRAIERSEAAGFPVEKSKEFANAVQLVSSFLPEVHDRAVSLQRFIEGEGITGDQFINGL